MTTEPEQHGSPPAHATGEVQFVALEDIALDETFRLRADGDVSQLAIALGRLGQLAPVELRRWQGAGSDGPQWQIVSGFRRLAAMRMLARDRVLARLHQDLGEGDAWGLALSEALLQQPLTGEELEALREKLRASGVAHWAEELVDEALVRAPVAAELRERFYDFLTATGEVRGPIHPPAVAEVVPGLTASIEPANQPSQSRLPDLRDERGWVSTPDLTPTPTEASAPVSTPTPTPASAATPTPIPTLTPSAPISGPETSAGPESQEPGGPVEPPVLEPREGAREEEYVEVTPDELVQDLIARLSTLNQDLATAVEAWKDLPMDGRKSIVDQARYVAALLPFMETPE